MYQYKREPLNDEEVERFLFSVKDDSRLELITLLLLETGIRVSELAELKPEQIDWQNKRITILGKGGPSGHNSKRRILKLSAVCFNSLKRGSLWIERNHEKTTWITPRTIQRQLHRAANRAKIIRPVSPHVLRHTFACRCLRRGIHLVVLMKLLGHENLKTTQGYLNLSPEDVIDEFERKW